MADTLIANAGLDEQVYIWSLKQYHVLIPPNLTSFSLRAIVRSLLATSSPVVAASFTAAARARLGRSLGKSSPSPAVLFQVRDNDPRTAVPTPELSSLLAHVRALYGAGMGFQSLGILAAVVRATSGLRWGEDGEMVDVLATVDADLSQAVQSCREELAAGYVADIAVARATLHDVRTALDDCQTEVESWGGEFPFERGAANAECLQVV